MQKDTEKLTPISLDEFAHTIPRSHEVQESFKSLWQKIRVDDPDCRKRELSMEFVEKMYAYLEQQVGVFEYKVRKNTGVSIGALVTVFSLGAPSVQRQLANKWKPDIFKNKSVSKYWDDVERRYKQA